MIANDVIYIDSNGNPVSEYLALFKVEDNSGNFFTLVRDKVWIPLKDGTTATLDTILNTIDSASNHLQSFLLGSVDFGKDLIDSVSSIFDNNPVYIDQFGNQTTEKFHYLFDQNGNQILDEEGNPIKQENKKVGPTNLELILADFASRVALGASIEEASIESTKNAIAREVSKDLIKKIGLDNQNLQNGIAVAIAKIGIMHMNGDDPDAEDYCIAAMEGILILYSVDPAIISGIIAATKRIAQENGKLNSDGYQDVAAIAISTVIVATICIQIGAAIGTLMGPGVGTVAGAVVGAVVGYLIAVPLYNAVRNGWENTEEIYDSFEDILKGEDIEENLKDLYKDLGDQLRIATVDLVRDIGRGAIKLFFGGYGKKLAEGEYWNPYSLLNIEAKADGTVSIIRGLEPQGVVAISSQDVNDDIYGANGSDNLIGKGGKNLIIGYEGNDYIEGRDSDDILVAGKGDDQIFGGSGDDQIYGSEGSDNLFGGDGDDVIIGGTGATIGGSGSSEDGADFIQGGNGDDQIMGEAGDDAIQGNLGNDIILGGTGNDRISGDDGDDSILGEDGEDMIFGNIGNDIIDGGAGNDYIEGNVGNDNIRGGDGDDEIHASSGIDIIYGDLGNDLINSGSENDLVFGGLGNDIIYGAEGDDTLSGELGNDYLIGADGADIIDGGDGDDVLFGGIGNDTITTGEGNDTIIYRLGDGDDTIIEANNFSNSENDVLRLIEINSKLSNNINNKVVLTKSNNDLIIQFKDDSNSIITNDKITIINQFNGSDINGTGNEILKKIEFADGKAIDLTNIIINADNSVSYVTSIYTNIDTSIQEELVLGYNDQMQIIDEQFNPASSYNANNYNSSAEQQQIDNELYNKMQWQPHKKKRSVFGGHYSVWTKYYEKNLNGTDGNDRIIGHWWSENIYGGNGNDQINGGDGDDNIYGGNGDDILHGGTGADKIYGESGQDAIYGGSDNDFISGGDGNDQIYGNSGNDQINGDGELTTENNNIKLNNQIINSKKWKFEFGFKNKQLFIENSPSSVGDDYIEGGDGDDKINDLSGHNIIIAGSGNDIINTGNGDDYIEGNDGNDQINAGSGNNLIYGNSGNDTITTTTGNDTIYGQDGYDFINAGSGDDYISGGANDDLINGEDGNDTIFGDIGVDQINGGNGNDYIYGGLGADTIKGDSGVDQIKGGDGDDLIEGNDDNDNLYGQSGSDKIYGNAGNDKIDGGIEGDVLDGGDGDDQIIGGQGNDILVDGAGSDTIDGGNDSDIIILTKERQFSNNIDTIKNWNKNEDRIILKVDYQNPITFANIQSNMFQNNDNLEINLDNGQKIIIENANIADITKSNFQIGLSGTEENDILFGTDGEDIIFGNLGDDKIYGGEGNDELWGGAGSDELYGEGGDDILRYEADGKYGNDQYSLIQSDETTSYWGFIHQYNHFKHFVQNAWHKTFYYSANLGDRIASSYINPINDIFIKDNLVINKSYQNSYQAYFYHYSYWIKRSSKKVFMDSQWSEYIHPTRSLYEAFPIRDIYGVREIIKHDYLLTFKPEYCIKNFHNSQLININGYNRTFDKFIGGNGVNTILMTEGNDVLALDDATSPSGSNYAGTSTIARIQNISVIHAGAGDDIINFSSPKYSYGDLVVYGADGNDKIWLSHGNDKVFGGNGNDEIFSGAGNDQIVGGEGNDLFMVVLTMI